MRRYVDPDRLPSFPSLDTLFSLSVAQPVPVNRQVDGDSFARHPLVPLLSLGASHWPSSLLHASIGSIVLIADRSDILASLGRGTGNRDGHSRHITMRHAWFALIVSLIVLLSPSMTQSSDPCSPHLRCVNMGKCGVNSAPMRACQLEASASAPLAGGTCALFPRPNLEWAWVLALFQRLRLPLAGQLGEIKNRPGQHSVFPTVRIHKPQLVVTHLLRSCLCRMCPSRAIC